MAACCPRFLVLVAWAVLVVCAESLTCYVSDDPSTIQGEILGTMQTSSGADGPFKSCISVEIVADFAGPEMLTSTGLEAHWVLGWNASCSSFTNYLTYHYAEFVAGVEAQWRDKAIGPHGLRAFDVTASVAQCCEKGDLCNNFPSVSIPEPGVQCYETDMSRWVANKSAGAPLMLAAGGTRYPSCITFVVDANLSSPKASIRGHMVAPYRRSCKDYFKMLAANPFYFQRIFEPKLASEAGMGSVTMMTGSSPACCTQDLCFKYSDIVLSPVPPDPPAPPKPPPPPPSGGAAQASASASLLLAAGMLAVLAALSQV